MIRDTFIVIKITKFQTSPYLRIKPRRKEKKKISFKKQRLNDFHERRKRKSARNERDENFQVFTVSLSPARQVAIRNFRCSRASGGASKREAALHQQGLKNGKYVWTRHAPRGFLPGSGRRRVAQKTSGRGEEREDGKRMVTNSQWHCATLSFTFLRPLCFSAIFLLPTATLLSFFSLPSLSPVFQALHTRSFPSTHYTHRVNIIYSSDVIFEGRFWRGWNECKSWYEIFDSSSPPHEKSALLERWKIKRSFERS